MGYSNHIYRITGRPRGGASCSIELENGAHFWAHALRRESEKPDQAGLSKKAYKRWEDAKKRWEDAKDQGFKHLTVPVKTRGFEPDPAGPFVHTYNADGVVRTWLRSNVLFSKLVSEIIDKERKSKVFDKTTTHDLSSVERLAGVELPKLYWESTGRKYGFSSTKTNELANTHGPKFVVMCYAVMCLPEPAVGTLRTH